MEESFITFRAARKAKEHGFDWPVQSYYQSFRGQPPVIGGERYQTGGLIGTNLYYILGEMNHNDPSKGDDEETWSRPTLTVLRKWLREKHQISIKIDDFTTMGRIRFDYNISELGSQEDSPAGTFETYEQALEEALEIAFENLKG